MDRFASMRGAAAGLWNSDATERRPVHPVVEWLAAYAWRLVVIAAATVGVLWLVGRLWVVFLSLVIAVLVSRALAWPADRLRNRGWPPALAALVLLVGSLAVLGGTLTLIGVAVRGEVDKMGPTVSRAVDDLENWLVEDSPFDVDRSDVDRFRRDAREAVSDALRSSSGTLVSGAVIAIDVFVSLGLGLIVTFFALKDGTRFARWAAQQLPEGRRPLAERLGSRAWDTLGGYLRGAALLGLVEGLVIAVTVALVGGRLAAAVGVFTFLMAFIPFAGAIVAGALAVLVALATAGGGAALVVLVVAVVVQQLDNDLLAPVVYGRSLELHPVIILLAVAAGEALFGLPGAFLAVPVTAVALNVIAEARSGLVAAAPGDDG
jgi:predicted PurR-regulated permease PerM